MIPFKAKVDFKSGITPGNFESGNNYKQHDLTDELVDAFHKAGFIDVDGLPTDIQLNPQNVILVPDDMTVQNQTVL